MVLIIESPLYFILPNSSLESKFAPFPSKRDWKKGSFHNYVLLI